jgi:hypothetical protein
MLVPGPPKEVETVRWIFETFVRDRQRFGEIAAALNRREVPAANGNAWTRKIVKSILCCERYIGNNVWNRASTKLNSKVARNARENWIRADGCIEPIVAKSLFLEAQEIIRQRSRKLSQEEKLEPLRRLLQEHGFLTARIIAAGPGVPTVSSYERWFGGLGSAYRLIGYQQRRPCRRVARMGRGPSDEMLLELLRPLLREHGYISHKIIANADGVPSVATYCRRFGGMKNLCDVLVKFPEHPSSQPYDNRRSRINGITYNLSDEKLLDRLRDVVRVHGVLSSKIIDATRGLPCRDTYRRHFGSMARVYQLIGYHPRRRQTLS